MGSEVLGTLKSADRSALWIVDDDEDDIEIDISGFGAGAVDRILAVADKLIGKRVSFAYGYAGLVLRPMASKEPVVYAWSEANPAPRRVTLKNVMGEGPPDDEKNLWLVLPVEEYMQGTVDSRSDRT